MNMFSDCHKLNILVLGDLMVDNYSIDSAERVYSEAPISISNIKQRFKRPGGAANFINNLRSIGVSVKIASCVGDDIEGNWLCNELRRLNVDTDGLILSNDRITTIKTISISANQQLVKYDEKTTDYISVSNENLLLSKNMLDNVDAVIIFDYAKGVVTPLVAQTTINDSVRKGIPVFVNSKRADCLEYYDVSPFSSMAKKFCDETDTSNDNLKPIDKITAQYLLLTKSENGLLLVDKFKKEIHDFPSNAKNAIYFTDEVDAIIPIFAVCCALGMDLTDCCKIANLANYDAVTQFGTTKVETVSDLLIEKSDSKIISFDEAVEWSKCQKANGKKIVFTNGCFDIIHAGHISSFKKAKAQGDYLIVGINSDNSVKRLKGPKRPIISELNRAKMLEALSFVDKVFIFDEDFPENIIQKISPNVLIKGKDWEGKPVAGSEFVKQQGGKVVYIDLEEGLSTTSIIGKILESNR